MRDPYAMNASVSAASYLLSSLGGLGLGSDLLDGSLCGSLGGLLGSLLGKLSGTLGLLGSLSLSGGSLRAASASAALAALAALASLSLLELGGGGATELVGEALDASTGVDELLLAGVGTVALVASSTFISDTVACVLKVLPQEHVTVHSTYWGWIPCFMVGLLISQALVTDQRIRRLGFRPRQQTRL